jgi:hypothetical protein
MRRLVYVNNFAQGANEVITTHGGILTHGGMTTRGLFATWSTSQDVFNVPPVEATPSGRYGQFLGRFGNSTVDLQLIGLPPQSRVDLGLKLLIIQSWDGNADPAGQWGPDTWRAEVVDGPTLFEATFSNNGGLRQSYPHPAGSSTDHPAMTGAVETWTHGYRDPFSVTPLDSVYQIDLSCPHVGPILTFRFSGTHLEGLDNESWGLDDVVVVVTPT